MASNNITDDAPKVRGTKRRNVAPKVAAWNAENVESTAYHEAGHAVMYCALGLGLKLVTIEPDFDGMDAGSTSHGGEYGEDDKHANTGALRNLAEESFWTRHAISCYAGAEAVRRYDPVRADWRAGADSDFLAARDAIDNVTGGDEPSFVHLEAYAKRRSEILVECYWPEIAAVAKALLRKKPYRATRFVG